jgi:hypothetical protein
MAESWQLELSCMMQVDVPTDWQAEPQEKNHVTLAVLSELLRLSTFYRQEAQSIHIKLTQVNQSAELTIRAETTEAPTHSKEWIHRCTHPGLLLDQNTRLLNFEGWAMV